jgi:hypothetical protein
VDHQPGPRLMASRPTNEIDVLCVSALRAPPIA